MTLALAPLWCIAILTILLIAAGIQDLLKLKISNLTTAAVLALALVVMVITGPHWSLWQNVAIFASTLFAGTLMFAAGKLGGGDVKLLAATSLWFDFAGVGTFLIAVALCGGLLALLILLARMLRQGDGVSPILFLNKGSGIPYGVAIAAGALFAVGMLRANEARSRSDPLGLPTIHSASAAGKNGSPSWIRTNDQVINSHLLYR